MSIGLEFMTSEWVLREKLRVWAKNKLKTIIYCTKRCVFFFLDHRQIFLIVVFQTLKIFLFPFIIQISLKWCWEYIADFLLQLFFLEKSKQTAKIFNFWPPKFVFWLLTIFRLYDPQSVCNFHIGISVPFIESIKETQGTGIYTHTRQK